VFAATYDNARIDRYYLGPLFFAWSWLAAAGGAIVELVAMRDAGGARAATGSRPAFDPVRAGMALVLGLVLLSPTAIGLREQWAQQDLSRSRLASQWLDEALAAFDEDAIVVSWWSYSTPLWYGTLIEGRRPDITIIDDRTLLDEGLGEVGDVIEANLDTRPVYLIRLTDADVDALRDRYTIEAVGQPGNLFRVTGRAETSTP
jgi:hypothetical protein